MSKPIDLTRLPLDLGRRQQGEPEPVGAVLARVIGDLAPLVKRGHRQAQIATEALETAPELKR
jgi:hypothetical protein